MFYPMRFSEPLAGVTNTILMNFYLRTRIRTRELIIVKYDDDDPLGPSPPLRMILHRLQGMESR